MKVKILKTDWMPRYATEGSSGMDLRAAIELSTTLLPGEIKAIPTGVKIALPEGYEAQIRPRSGLAVHHGITVLNAPGTIDEDYRGEIKVPLINLGHSPYTILRGDAIAQMVVKRVIRAELLEVEELPPSKRGSKGFGSTGR